MDEPDIRLAGLSIWVDGWERPSADKPHDADWLLVRVRCEAGSGIVSVAGSILGASDLARFRQEVEALNATLTGSAVLASYEPNLHVQLDRVGSLGQFEAVVDITPDYQTQSHRFRFAVDQSYFAGWLRDIGRVLACYPVRVPKQD